VASDQGGIMLIPPEQATYGLWAALAAVTAQVAKRRVSVTVRTDERVVNLVVRWRRRP
jgi:hypothetical protein